MRRIELAVDMIEYPAEPVMADCKHLY